MTEVLLGEFFQQGVDAVFFPLGGAVLALDGGEAPEEATGVDDLKVVVESGAEVNDILGLDVHKAVVEGVRRVEEICKHAVIGHVQCRVQDGVGIRLAVPGAADDFGVRGDLGEFID